MITVKRYNPDAAMSISREHAWMRETPEGGHVEYGDYASLFAQFELVKAERDALERQLSMSEAKCKGYFSDAAAALVKCDALEVRLRNALSSEQESIQRAHAANQTIDALAVESIGLRHIAERIVNALYAAGYEPEENSLHPWKSLIFDAEKALETPATDAALAAIRNEATARVLKHLCDCQLISATVAELKADELREAK
ncbi:hypothetical protein [Serratia sp. CY81593]|uniref:hypothetical protein n=1 Tax=Serratia sp. CY81593 TaxID=3383685 RepID=UPI003F9FF645